MKPRRQLPSPVVKRSINLDPHQISVGLEDDFWNALKEIAAAQPPGNVIERYEALDATVGTEESLQVEHNCGFCG